MISKSEIIRARVRAFKNTLKNATPEQKKGDASTFLANNFNGIVKEVGENYPDLKEALPSPITSDGPFSEMNQSDVSYLELEILADQLLALMDLVEDD